MILGGRTELIGNKTDRIIQALKMSGWYEGRKVDISNTEKYYKDRNIELFPTAKNFFSEFSAIASNWYISIKQM